MSEKKNSHGGAREGAGRPRNPEPETVRIEGERDNLKLLQDIAFGVIEVSPNQLRAAIAAIQYTHPKVGEAGKKQSKQEEAKKVAGKFSASAPPKLGLVK